MTSRTTRTSANCSATCLLGKVRQRGCLEAVRLTSSRKQATSAHILINVCHGCTCRRAAQQALRAALLRHCLVLAGVMRRGSIECCEMAPLLRMRRVVEADVTRELRRRVGYQWDYVFDWTILKYQQLQQQTRAADVGTLSRGREADAAGASFRATTGDASRARR